MPTRKRSDRPKVPSNPPDDSLPADLIVSPGHIAVHLRTALRLLKQAERAGGAGKLIDGLADFGDEHPDSYVLLPASLASITGCEDTSGTPAAAFLKADMALLAGAILFSFTYTRTDGLGCVVQDISEVSIQDKTTGSGAQSMSQGAVAQLENINVPLTNPPEQRWSGKQTTVGATGGAINAGDVVQITVTFPVKTTKRCHKCTPNPVTISTSVTVK